MRRLRRKIWRRTVSNKIVDDVEKETASNKTTEVELGTTSDKIREEVEETTSNKTMEAVAIMEVEEKDRSAGER